MEKADDLKMKNENTMLMSISINNMSALSKSHPNAKPALGTYEKEI